MANSIYIDGDETFTIIPNGDNEVYDQAGNNMNAVGFSKLMKLFLRYLLYLIMQ